MTEKAARLASQWRSLAIDTAAAVVLMRRDTDEIGAPTSGVLRCTNRDMHREEPGRCGSDAPAQAEEVSDVTRLSIARLAAWGGAHMPLHWLCVKWL